MPDLMFPLIIVAFMLLIIECMESPLFLMILGIVWMPVGVLFLTTGNYDTLFQASFTYTPQIKWLMAGIMSCVSIACFMRMMFINRTNANQAVIEK